MSKPSSIEYGTACRNKARRLRRHLRMHKADKQAAEALRRVTQFFDV